MGRMYSVPFSGITVSAAQDLIRVSAPSTAVVVVHSVSITQDTDETSQQLPFQIHRASTDGSGGSAVTPTPLLVGDPAFAGTAARNNTTRATAGVVIRRRSENLLNGVHWVFTPEERIVIPPSGRVVVGLETAPAAGLPFSGEMIIEEIG